MDTMHIEQLDCSFDCSLHGLCSTGADTLLAGRSVQGAGAGGAGGMGGGGGFPRGRREGGADKRPGAHMHARVCAQVHACKGGGWWMGGAREGARLSSRACLRAAGYSPACSTLPACELAACGCNHCFAGCSVCLSHTESADSMLSQCLAHNTKATFVTQHSQ